MTTAYGLAAVTATLKSRLEDRLALEDAQAAIGPVSVTSLPPDQVQAGASEPNQLNVYLHHVTPSGAHRNAGHPIRDPNGNRIASPPLALDLQYLVTAFGVETYAAEILLGLAIAELHEHPLLDMKTIDQVLHPAVPDPTIPAAVAASALEDQGEPLRITPVSVGSEEMSRLWTAQGAQYRATAAYLISPLLISPVELGAASLPVVTPSIGAQTFEHLTVLDVVLAPTGPGPADPRAPITRTDRVLLRGHGLQAPDAQVMVGDESLPIVEARVDGIVVDLTAATTIRPGPVPVYVVHGTHARSNAAHAIVRPIVSASVGGNTLTCTVVPPVGRDQRAVLLLNERNAAPGTRPQAYVLNAPGDNGAGGAPTSASIPFHIGAVLPGSYLVRLEIDGASSVLTTNALGRFDAPAVTV